MDKKMLMEMEKILKVEDRPTISTMVKRIQEAISLDPELKPIIEKLDYFLGSYWGEGIYVDADAEDVFVSTAPGGIEGVYIDGYLGIYREDDGEMEKIQFLTVKTLEEGYDALLDMSRLSGAIQYAGDRFLWINNDLITAK